MRLKDRHRNYLIAADFYQAFLDHASAEAAFHVFDKDNHGDISRAELKTAVLKVYKERRFLSRSMRDVGEALKTLDRMLMFLAAVILVFIGLSVFGVQIGNSLTSLYSLLIAASFIFKNTASSMFDAVMFCFVTQRVLFSLVLKPLIKAGSVRTTQAIDVLWTVRIHLDIENGH